MESLYVYHISGDTKILYVIPGSRVGEFSPLETKFVQVVYPLALFLDKLSGRVDSIDTCLQYWPSFTFIFILYFIQPAPRVPLWPGPEARSTAHLNNGEDWYAVRKTFGIPHR